jgi:hypothetical protein
MAFDRNTWRAQTRQIIEELASNPVGVMAQARASTLYSFLLASTIPPIAATYTTDPAAVIAVLIDVAGPSGAKLIANLGQHGYAGRDAIAIAAEESQRPELAPAYDQIAKKLGVIAMAEQALAQANQPTVLAQLRGELRQLDRISSAGVNIRIEQSGGVNLGANNSIGRIGEIVGGNKISGEIPEAPSIPEVMDTISDRRQHVINAHSKRLQLLEMQAARSGYNTPPEVLAEIDSIRAEIARLMREQE